MRRTAATEARIRAAAAVDRTWSGTVLDRRYPGLWAVQLDDNRPVLAYTRVEHIQPGHRVRVAVITSCGPGRWKAWVVTDRTGDG